ncbi:MAG: DUF106 domain-containing protein [Candidatus Micrarchaeota archaeon]|nr:DUF106 domain-containing protein [Candidatus Micrarchaeota archaeon]
MIFLGYEIVVVAVVYALGALFLQRKVTNMHKMYEMQDQIKQKSDELMKHTKEGTKTKEELAAMQKEVMTMVSMSMRNQMKPMLVMLPTFLVVYYALIPYVFGTVAAGLTFTSFNLTYQSFFLSVAIVVGLVCSVALMLLDKRKRKAAKATVSAQQ